MKLVMIIKDAPKKIGNNLCMHASAMHIYVHAHFFIFKQCIILGG